MSAIQAFQPKVDCQLTTPLRTLRSFGNVIQIETLEETFREKNSLSDCGGIDAASKY